MASVPVLARLIARPLETLGKHLSAALEGDPHSIHQARVASRRLRELLPIVGGVLKRGPRRRLRRRLRALTRALGPVREVDVELMSVDQMTGSLPTPPAAAGEVKRELARERTERLASLTRRFDAGRVDRLLRRLHRLQSTLADGVEPDRWRLELAQRVGRRAEALSDAVADAGALFASERLHAVRIAAKQLRYGLEVVGDARLAPAGSMVRSLKETQDILGKLHDADILLGSVKALADERANASQLPDARHAIGARLETDTRLEIDTEWFDREITAETRRLHARYLRRQSSLVRLADAVLDSLVGRIEQRHRSLAS